MVEKYKILIDDEEVVCESKFEIKEEFMNPSHTELYKVFPKSWKGTNKLLTDYYFPKDYTKCKIFKTTYIPPEEGETVTGQNFTIKVDTNKKFDYKLQGNTQQDGTPTPSNPQEIKSVTGRQVINVVGKNLLNSLGTNNAGTTVTSNGINYTFNENGSITIQGTSTGLSLAYLLGNNFNDYSIQRFFIDEDYVVNGWDNNNIILMSRGIDGTYRRIKGTNSVDIKNIEISLIYIQIASGITVNETIYPMIRKASIEDDTYEPYKGKSYEVNLGKNLFDYSKISNGYYDNNGNYNSSQYSTISDYIKIVDNKYTASTNIAMNNITINEFDENKNWLKRTVASNSNKNTVILNSNTKYIRTVFRLFENIVLTEEKLEEIEAQIEVGSQATSYAKFMKNNLFTNKNLTDNHAITTNGELTETTYWCISDYMRVGSNQKIIYKGLVNIGSNVVQCAYYDSNYNFISTFKQATGTNIITTPDNAEYVRFSIFKGADQNTFIIWNAAEAQYPIELTDEDYIRKSTGKNLFDKDNANYLLDNVSINANTGIVSTATGFYTLKIPCKPNTTYTVSKVVSSRFTVGYSNNLTYTSGEALTYFTVNNTATNITITTGNEAKSLYVFYSKLSNETTYTLQQILNSIQIEEGSNATDLEPYGKVWYIEKKIGKIVLDGNENWIHDGTKYDDKYYLFYTNSLGLPIKQDSALGVSDYFRGIAYNDRTIDYKNTLYINNWIGIIADKDMTNATNATKFKSWLSTNNVTLWYQLATPKIELITNDELIEQLDELENMELFDGINNISIDGSLSGILKLHYNYVVEETVENLYFTGLVKNTADMTINPFKPHYCSLQILDPSTLLSEGDLLNFVIVNKTITGGIYQVINAISEYGFVAGNIQIPNDSIIGAYSTLEKAPYDVFNYFANISGTRWGTRMIDENTTAIDFYSAELLENSGTIECTKEYFRKNKIDSIDYDYSTADYRNKQIITSDEVFGNVIQTETKIADGYSNSFVSENKLGRITRITINGVESTFATKSEEELGKSADFIYQPGETTFSSNNTISVGSIIVISYYPIVKGREIVLNSQESNRILEQLDRKGVIARYENRNDVTSSNELLKVGQSYIKYKGIAELNINIVSRRDFLILGGKYEFNSPLADINGDYLVKEKNTKILQAGDFQEIVYEYVLTNSFDTENEINYFDNQRSKLNGNISEGETITRNIDLESASLIKFYDTNIEEAQIGSVTTLDFPLDSILI